MQNKTLKSSYSIQNKFEPFYTGGHTELSKNGEYLFCMCGNKIKVLDVSSGRVVHSLGKEEDDEVTSFTVSPDEETLVTALKNGLLLQWDWKNESVIRSWKNLHMGPVRVMAFSPDSTVLATGGSDSTIKIWDIVKQYCTHNLKGASGVFSVVKFHPDGERNLLFGAADDCAIRVWHLTTSSKHKGEFKGHFSVVTDLAFTSDGNTLISSGRDKVVLIWNIEDYQLKKTIPAFEGIESVMVVPDDLILPHLNIASKDLHIITAGTKGALKVWNVQTSSPLYTQFNLVSVENQDDTQALPQIKSATYNSELNAICVVTYEHCILFYKLETLELFKQFVGYNDEILDLCFIGEHDSHIAVITNSSMIKIYELATFNCQVLEGHSDLVLTVKAVPFQEHRLVTGAKDNTLRLWQMNAETKIVSCLFVGSGHTLAVNAVACSSEFIVSGSQDTTLKVWDIPKREYHVIATPSLSSRCTEKAHDKDINSVAISPNEKLIASASHDKTAKIWKAENLELIATLRGHRKGIWCTKFSTIDQVLATSSADGTIKLWSLSNFGCLKTFEGHESSVLNVSFLSRAMQLITTASDGNMKLWTIKTNECVKTIDAHQDKTWALAVSKNEEILITGAADSVIIVWKNMTEEEKAEIQAKEDDLILKEQKLSNYIQNKKWTKALKIALLLNQPFRTLNIIKEILLDSNQNNLQSTMENMREDQISTLLKFACTWNTNSKHCEAAQAILHAVLKLYTPEELLKFSDIKELVEGLSTYTERHFQRLNRLLQQSTFVDYMWQNMNVVGAVISEPEMKISSVKTKATGFFEDKSKDFGNEEESEVTRTNTDDDQSKDLRKTKKSRRKGSDRMILT